jgi:hypothetical protein
MSLEAEKLEVQCGSSTCEGSTKSRISQAETQNEHQDPVPFAPTQVTSMLARRSTFSSADEQRLQLRATRQETAREQTFGCGPTAG